MIRRPRALSHCRRCALLEAERDNVFRMLIVLLVHEGGRFELSDTQLNAIPSARVTWTKTADGVTLELEFEPHGAELQ